MPKDPEKARKRAREEYAQIRIRIRAQEKEVARWDRKDPVKWHHATLQLKKLEEKQQAILRRMQ